MLVAAVVVVVAVHSFLLYSDNVDRQYIWNKALLKTQSVTSHFKDETCLFYIRTECVPRRKHSPPQLHKTNPLMLYKAKVHTEHLNAM